MRVPLNIGICGALGGNTDNDVNTGTFYFNLNNTPSNTNWSIATAQTYTNNRNNAPHFPYLLVKLMVKSKQLLVALSKAVETIREGDYGIIQSFMGRINIRR